MPEERGRKRTRERKTNRWSYDEQHITSGLSAIPKFLPYNMTTEQMEALIVRVGIEELTRKLNIGELDIDYSLERSPSPEPIYDISGKRINTREQRARDRLNLQRQKLVEDAMKMNPNFKPPVDFTPVNIKKQKKIWIPVDKYPGYNFIGLILGPRGNTQKRMEKETGCKIVIRGKGSITEGKAARQSGPVPGEDEPLHVLLTADSEEQLDRAGKMITELLVPMEEGKNEHKRQQLRELAIMNGTLRDTTWMQPTSEMSFEPANVKCAICGEVSHPTSDCSMRGSAIPTALNSEYDKFLTEIGEAPPPSQIVEPTPQSANANSDAYSEFLASISEVTSNAPVPWGQNAQYPPGGANPWMGGQVPWGAQVPWMPQPGGMPPWMQQPGVVPTADQPGGVPSAVPPYGVPNPWQQNPPTY